MRHFRDEALAVIDAETRPGNGNGKGNGNGHTDLFGDLAPIIKQQQLAWRPRKCGRRHQRRLQMQTVTDYATVLAKLQQVAPEAHIAGGAVRDTILHKPIKDIDVFMDDKHVE